MALSKRQSRTRILDLSKNGAIGKTGPQGLKKLPFVSNHMKGNAEVIHCHIKGSSVQDLFFVQIRFEMCTTISYFKNCKVGVKQQF